MTAENLRPILLVSDTAAMGKIVTDLARPLCPCLARSDFELQGIRVLGIPAVHPAFVQSELRKHQALGFS